MTTPRSLWFEKIGHHLLILALFLIFWEPRCTAAPISSMRAELPNSSRSFLNSLSRRRCPPMESSTLVAINQDTFGIESVKHENVSPFSCKHIARCDVTVYPQEAIVSWYSIDDNENENLISSKTQRDVTIDLMARQKNPEKLFGMGSTTNRICLDPYMPNSNQKYRFKCKAESMCDTSKDQSRVIEVKSKGHPIRINRFQSVRQAPIITMTTSLRMEKSGQLVEVFCHASGSPRPKITWTVLDEIDDKKSYPIEDFSYIRVLENNDVIVDTSGISSGSLSLLCTASNKYGYDSKDATILALEKSK